MSKIKRALSTNSGFTLIELMIVIVVLGILAGIAIPRITGIREDANVNAVKSELRSVQTALEMYATDSGNNNKYPTSLDELEDISEDGLKGPDGTDYGYATNASEKKYVVWYKYIDGDEDVNSSGEDNALIYISSESGLGTTYSTESGGITTNSIISWE